MRRLLGDEAIAAEILDSFLEVVPSSLRELQAASEGGDFPVIRDIAHGLKGTAANLGAELLSELAHRVQDDADSGNGSAASRGIQALVSEFDALAEVIDRDPLRRGAGS